MEFPEESPPVEDPLLERFEISTLEERAKVIDAALDKLLGVFTFDDRDRFIARLCLDEAITNACEHGRLESSGAVKVTLYADPPRWVLRVLDQGPGYSRADVDSREVDPYAEGGRGLPILEGYAQRVVVAAGGRELTVWLETGAGAPRE